MRKTVILVLISTCFGFTAEARNNNNIVPVHTINNAMTGIVRHDRSSDSVRLAKAQNTVILRMAKYDTADMAASVQQTITTRSSSLSSRQNLTISKNVSVSLSVTNTPNLASVFVSIASANLRQYRSSGDEYALRRVFFNLNWPVDNYSVWGKQWSSPPAMSYLAIMAWQLRNKGADGELLWEHVRPILAEEANNTLGLVLPYLPLNSSPSAGMGDSKGEENGWQITGLSAAIVFLPDNPNVPAWEARLRQLGWDTIARPSDPPDVTGLKVITVGEKFDMVNHWTNPNAFYTVGTAFLLMQAALPYRLVGRAVPAELNHNVEGLYGKYTTYLGEDASGELVWTTPQDSIIPGGDPSALILPTVMDVKFQLRLAEQKVAQGYLWMPGPIPTTISSDDDATLLRVVMDGKTTWYYTVANLWSFPPTD